MAGSDMDWYDWLSENEDIRGGKVRLFGVSRGRESHNRTRNEGRYFEREAGAERRRDRSPLTQDFYRGSDDDEQLEASYSEVIRQVEALEEGRSRMHLGGMSGIRPHGASRAGSAPQRWRSSPLRSPKTKLEPKKGSIGAMEESARMSRYHTYLINREMREIESRIDRQIQTEVAQRMEETEARMLEEMREENAYFRSFYMGSDALQDTFNSLRASNKDLSYTLQDLTVSLNEHLARIKVDC